MIPYLFNQKTQWTIVVLLGFLCCIEVGACLLGDPVLNPLPSVDLRLSLHKQHVVETSSGCEIHPDLTNGVDSTVQVMSPQTFPCLPSNRRIVLLGGSTVQGYGVSKTENLQANLSVLSETEYDVVNLGAAGYTSSQIVEMLPEVWDLKPDVLVVYTGHNDVIFYPEIQQVFEENQRLIEVRRTLRKSHAFQWFESSMLPIEIQEVGFDNKLQSVYDQIVDVPTTSDEIKQSHVDALFHEENIQTLLMFNIQQILNQASEKEVGVVLVGPIYRIDAPILAGLFDVTMDNIDIQEFTPCLDMLARPKAWNDPIWQKCLDANDTYGPLRFQYGKMLWNQRRYSDAYSEWRLARAHTPAMFQGHFPKRWTGALNALTHQSDVSVVNLFPKWHSQSGFVQSSGLFVDSIHLNNQGNALLASILWKEIQQLDDH